MISATSAATPRQSIGEVCWRSSRHSSVRQFPRDAPHVDEVDATSNRFVQGRHQRILIAGRNHPTGHTGLDPFGCAAAIGGDHGESARHRFGDDETEAVVHRGERDTYPR